MDRKVAMPLPGSTKVVQPFFLRARLLGGVTNDNEGARQDLQMIGVRPSPGIRPFTSA